MSPNTANRSGTAIADVRTIEPDIYKDARGWFSETFNQAAFDSLVGQETTFVQDNQSNSHKGVLRGLHYQLAPKAQGKLVRAVRGAVFDVGVDLRRSSSTFGQWVGMELSAENGKQLWLPPGFAHGFLVLTSSASVVYKVTEYYSPEHERSLHWADPDIGILWPSSEVPTLSERDASAPSFREADVFD